MMRKKCPQCFDLLGVKTRLKIVQQVKRKPQNVSEIEESFSLTQPTISYHLQVLKKAGVLKTKKQGRETHYYFNKKYPCKDCVVAKL